MRRILLMTGLGWSTASWACSGPGAEDAIATSAQIAQGVLGLVVVCSTVVFAVPKLRPRGALGIAFWAGLPLVDGLFALTLGLSRGDCGFELRNVSLVLAAVVILAMLGWVANTRRRTRVP